MKIAIISDIHGNYEALEAVLKDIDIQNPDLFICGGDILGYGPSPNEVVDKIRDRKILSIIGNNDQDIFGMAVVNDQDYKSKQEADDERYNLHFNRENISNQNMVYLRSLPKEVILNIENKAIKLVHGSPRKIDEHMYEDSPETLQIIKESCEKIIICAHTHLPYIKWYEDKLVVNSGTVGKPKDGKVDADYVVIDINDYINAEIKTVQYDYEKTASKIERCGLSKQYADIIRTGKPTT